MELTDEPEAHARIQDARRRAREHRWSAPGRAIVRHPAHGKIIVPCRSKTSAILCAAEKWGVTDWLGLAAEVTVHAVEQEEEQ